VEKRRWISDTKRSRRAPPESHIVIEAGKERSPLFSVFSDENLDTPYYPKWIRFLSFPKVLNDFQIFGIRFDGQLPIDGLVSVFGLGNDLHLQVLKTTA
jgi:hypothetical protein